MWKPRRFTTLWAFTSSYRDSFLLDVENWMFPKCCRFNRFGRWTKQKIIVLSHYQCYFPEILQVIWLRPWEIFWFNVDNHFNLWWTNCKIHTRPPSSNWELNRLYCLMWNIHNQNYRSRLFIVSASVSKRFYYNEWDVVIDVRSWSKLGEF
jgi:hypothetical protein